MDAGGISLLDVLCSLDQADPTHYMVAVFDSENLSDFLGDCDATARDDLCEEGNVFFLDLYRQMLASGKWLRTQSYNF